MTDKLLYHPTHLWVSDPETATTKITDFLQKTVCQHHDCKTCISCRQIKDKEHPWIKWLSPERFYTLDQMDEILHHASFQLNPEEFRFFIIQNAECLTDNCSNRLLKTIEEPFPRYYFFFLTDRPESLPLTIQSRCLLKKFESKIQDHYKNIVTPFINLQFNDPINFIKQIENLDIKEYESKKLIDDLYGHWSEILKEKIINQHSNISDAKAMIQILEYALTHPPMPGGVKLFWKNLYLNADYATKNNQNIS